MAGSCALRLLLLVVALLICLPRMVPAIRNQQHVDVLAAASEGSENQPVSPQALRSACRLVDEDELSEEDEREILNSIRRWMQVPDRLAKVDSQLQPRPCFVPMLVQLMTRGRPFHIRVEARAFLNDSKEFLDEAREFMELWEQGEQRTALRLEMAVNGSLRTDPEAQALATRFYDSNISVQKGASNNLKVYGALTVLREPMTDVECAQSCVYATEMAAKANNKLFDTEVDSSFLGCVAYVLLRGQRCVLFPEPPSNNRQSTYGSGRVRLYPKQAAVQFCMADSKAMALGDVGTAAAVTSCQEALSNQYSSAGAQQVTKLQNPTVVKHICRAECESLARDIRHVQHRVVSFYGHAQGWCTRDVVQVVQSHELQCCGDACGWDSATKSCSGIHLLSKLGQEEWFAECCSPSAVMQGSDRDYMCQSASKVIWQRAVGPKGEPQPGSLEAFQWGEDANPNFEQAKTTTTSSTSQLEATPTTTTAPTTSEETTTQRSTQTTTTAGSITARKTTTMPLSLGCQTVLVGSSTTNTKTVPLPQAWLSCGARPANKPPQNPTATFVVNVSGSILRVRRSDAPNLGWQFPLELSCCVTPQALVEMGASRVAQPTSEMFQSAPCALRCTDPTFMKSALLQCSASLSREWVAIREGAPTCPQAGLIKSEKTPSPADCAQLGASTTSATHASWRFLPGDKSEGSPHLGLCSFFRRCGQQEGKMFASTKAMMSNDTEVLWTRLAVGR